MISSYVAIASVFLLCENIFPIEGKLEKKEKKTAEINYLIHTTNMRLAFLLRIPYEKKEVFANFGRLVCGCVLPSRMYLLRTSIPMSRMRRVAARPLARSEWVRSHTVHR